MMRSIAILGASRGLGAALEKVIQAELPEAKIMPLSRQHGADFTKVDSYEDILNQLSGAELDTLVYVAGGGPFGDYASKEWKDHQWAFRLNFEFPAQLLHHFLQNPGTLKKLVFVGSSVAESKPDPGAASYAASKHGLKGLIESVIAENPPLTIQLFSPGYMDTDMLTANAWPRQQGLAEDPAEVARRLWQWSESTVECGSIQEEIDVRQQS